MDIGAVLVYLMLALGVTSVGTSVVHLYLKDRLLRTVLKLLVFFVFIVSTATFLLLVSYFLGPNLDIAYVHGHTSTDYVWYYKLTGLWAGEEGTIVLWVWFIALSLFVEELIQHRRSRKASSVESRIMLYDWIRAISMIVLVAFVVLLTLIDVFAPTSTGNLSAFPKGTGMNRLLLTPLMIAHPPVEFAAYAFVTIPLASAFAYLITGDRKWTESSLQWSRLSWLFLSIGIGIGAIWAYISLGWGGYWGWDPVEVANLIPWIALTGFVHSQQYFRKRKQYTHLAPLLAIITFVLIVFATFETRSGFITSPLHAFTGPGTDSVDPGDRLVAILEGNLSAAFFMTMMLAVLILGGMLFMWRFAQIRKKEGSFNDVAYASSAIYVVFLAILLGFSIANVASFVSLGLDMSAFAGNKGIGLAIISTLLMSYPLLWILFTSKETEEDSKPLTLSSIINDKSAMLVSVAIFAIWFTVTFLLMVLGSEGLQPEVFTTRLPFIIAALAITMTVCLAWIYLGRMATGYLIIALIVAVLVASLAFSENAFAIYISVLAVALFASFLRIFKVALVAKQKERKLQIAGMFILVAGIIGILFWSNLTRIYFILPGVKPDLTIGILGFIASSIAMIGGIFCLRGRGLRISVVGAIGGILSLGFFFLGTALALIALVLILASRPSFSKAPTDLKCVRATLGGTAPHIIHLGIVLLLIGYAASTYLSMEDDLIVLRSPVEFKGYEFELTGSESADADNDLHFEDIKTYMEITRDGSYVGNVTFHLWWMIPPNPSDPPHYMLDVYVENTYLEDLYFIGYAFNTVDDGWIQAMEQSGRMFTSNEIDNVALQVKTLPLMNALWGGMWIMTLGICLLVFVDYLPTPSKPRKDIKVEPKTPVEETPIVEEAKKDAPILEDRDKDYESLLEEELRKLEEE